MAKKYSSGFQSDAADKIWRDHIGNNAWVRHRDQCAICLEAYRTRGPITKTPEGYYTAEEAAYCKEGERIFDEMLDEVYAKIDEVNQNGN